MDKAVLFAMDRVPREERGLCLDLWLLREFELEETLQQQRLLLGFLFRIWVAIANNTQYVDDLVFKGAIQCV